MLRIILFIVILYAIRLYFYFSKENNRNELKNINLQPGNITEYDPKAELHPFFATTADMGFWDKDGNYKEDIQPITDKDLI